MPLPGQYQLNYMKNVMHHPCKFNGDVSLIIETAAQAAFVAGITYVTQDCNDLLLAEAVERQGIAISKQGPLNRNLAFKNGHRSVSVHKPGSVGAVAHNGATWALDNIVRPLRFIGSGFFVYGLTLQFLTQWTSLLYAFNNCDDGVHHTVEGPLSFPFVVVDGFTQALLLGSAEDNSCVTVGANSIAMHPGCLCNFSWYGQWKPVDPAKPGVITTWINESGGGVSQQSQFPNPDDPSANATINWMPNIKGGLLLDTTVQILARASGGDMKLTSGSFTVTCSGLGVPLLPQAGCGPKPSFGLHQ